MTELNRPPRKPDYMPDLWYRWFIRLHERVGGQVAPTNTELDFMTSLDLRIDQETESGKKISDLEKQLGIGDGTPLPETVKQVDLINRKIELLEIWNARIAEIDKQLEMLRRESGTDTSVTAHLAELEKRIAALEIEVNAWP
jgi:transposase-like protein